MAEAQVSPSSPRLKRKQKIDPKADDGVDAAAMKSGAGSAAAATTMTTITTTTSTPSPPKKAKKDPQLPQVIFACNQCDFKDTLEKVRSHRLAANHTDSRQKNGGTIGLRVAIAPTEEEEEEEEDEDFKVEVDEKDDNDEGERTAAVESGTRKEGNEGSKPADADPDVASSIIVAGASHKMTSSSATTISSTPVKTPRPLTFVGLDEYFYCEDSNRMKCRNCSMIFQTKAVSGHIPRCRSKKFVCALCSTGFSSEEALRTHKQENHFTCDVCGRDFLDAGDFLERHQLKCKKMKELKIAGQVVGEIKSATI